MYLVSAADRATSLTNYFVQVYKGTQHAGKEIKDAKLWDNANKWLSERR
jgi:hypothetical protein